jgi:F-type H+-transporting ATPase subunit b
MLDFTVTFIITLINITVLFFILRAILFKPVTEFMEGRARRVQDSLDRAEKEKAEARELLAKYEARLKNIEAEAASIIREAREKAGREAQRIIDNGKAEAAAFLINARKQDEAERHAAMALFKAEAAALVVAASARLVQRDLAADDNRKYANMLLEELSAQKRNL